MKHFVINELTFYGDLPLYFGEDDYFNWVDYGINWDIALQYYQRVTHHIRCVREANRSFSFLTVDEELLIEHDASKFFVSEFPFAARHFLGDKGDPTGYAFAWHHHMRCNPHHWQYWIFPDGYTLEGADLVDGCLPMPERYIREMVADWLGSSLSYTGGFDMGDWLRSNVWRLRFHPKTAGRVRWFLAELGYKSVMDSLSFASDK